MSVEGLPHAQGTSQDPAGKPEPRGAADGPVRAGRASCRGGPGAEHTLASVATGLHTHLEKAQTGRWEGLSSMMLAH